MKHLWGFVVVGLVVVGMGWVWAAEKAELQTRAVAEREADARRAQEVAAREERERMERQHDEEHERHQAERRERELAGIREMLRELHERKERLLTNFGENHPEVKDVQHQIRALEKELEQSKPPVFDHPRPNPREELAGKIEHLHAAAEHLHQAGMPDMARELHEQAEAMERELHRQHEGHEPDHRLGEVMEVVQDLRREMERLRDEVAELREQLQRDKP